MSGRNLMARASLAFGLVLLACGDPKAPSPSVGSNSNWLKACDIDADCNDERACRCGACTLGCEDDGACSALAGARCAAAEEAGPRSLCGGREPEPPAGICLPRCEPGACFEGQACVAGSCVLAVLPDVAFCEPVVAATDAQRQREDELLALVLQERAGGGLVCAADPPAASAPPLRLDPRLTCAARVFAQDIEATGQARAIDSQGRSTTDRLRAVEYVPQLWGESFAVRAPTPERALRLMQSDLDTCRRFADARFQDVGVANAGDSYVVVLGLER